MTSRRLARAAARAAEEKNGEDIVILDLAELLGVTDYFIICSAGSERQVKAIERHIEEQLAAVGKKPIGVEGEASSKWVLVDYGDIVVHIFDKETREYYRLETLWGDAPRLEWK